MNTYKPDKLYDSLRVSISHFHYIFVRERISCLGEGSVWKKSIWQLQSKCEATLTSLGNNFGHIKIKNSQNFFKKHYFKEICSKFLA